MIRKIVFYIVPIWAVFVATAYFYEHRTYFSSISPEVGNSTLETVLFFTILVFTQILFWGLITFIARQLKITRLNWWMIVLMFFISSVVFCGIRFAWDDFAMYEGSPLMNGETQYGEDWSTIEPQVQTTSLSSAILNIGATFALPFLELILVILAICSLGFGVLRLFRFSLPPPYKIAFSLGLGLMGFSLVLFVLAQLNLFSVIPVLVLLGLSLLVGYKDLIELFKYLNKEASLKIKPFNPKSFGLLVLILFIFALNFIEVNFPAPSGFDDFRLYLNLPNLLADSHGFIHGQSPYAFTLIQGLGPLLFKNIIFSKLILFVFFPLAMLPLYLFVKSYFSKNISQLLLLLTVSIPTFYAHTYLQVKPDFILVFLSLLALISWQFWVDKKENKWIYLAGALVGFAFTVKITAAFLIVALFVMVLWRTRVLKTILIFGITILVAASPWLINNLGAAIITDSYSLNALVYDTINPSPSLNWEELGMPTESCVSTGAADADYGRYTQDRGNSVLQFLMLPWDATQHASSQIIYSNLSFLFLGLLPILFFIKKPSKQFISITLGGLAFWFAWGFLGSGVIWYGFSGFVFLLFWLIASLDLFIKHSKFTRVFVGIFLVVWVVSGFYLRGNLFFNRTHKLMPYISGLATYEEFWEYTYPGYEFLTKMFNEDFPEATIFTTSPANFYYLIENNEERILFDQFYDDLNCLLYDRDENLFAERLKNSGFDFIVLPVPEYDPAYPPDFYTLKERILEMVNDNIPFVYTNGEIYIYYLAA